MSTRCHCLALRKASRRLTAVYDEALSPVGLTVAQYSQLRTIRGNGPLSLTELGQRLELDRSTVGRNIKVLERLGLVVVASGSDQREAVVELSPDGQRALAEADPLWHDVQSRIEAKLGHAGVETLQRLLADV